MRKPDLPPALSSSEVNELVLMMSLVRNVLVLCL